MATYQYAGRELTPDSRNLVEYGAKATCSVTLVAWGSWVDGLTIVTPTVGSKTIKKTAAGDIDVSGAADIAEAADIVGAYLAAAAGSVLDYVGTVGQVMTFRAKAYGRDLNGTVISGTLLDAAAAMGDGVDPYDGKTVRSEVIYDAAVDGASVTITGLSPAKRYRISGTVEQNGSAEFISIAPNGAGASYYTAYGTGGFNHGASISIAYIPAVSSPMAFSGVLEPRRNGYSMYRGNSALTDGQTANFAWVSAATSCDFTEIEVVFSASSRTGWLTVREETP